jgi:hypothetical protein
MCMFCRSLFVLFLLAIVLSVLLRYTDSDYTYGIFTLITKINTNHPNCLQKTLKSELGCLTDLKMKKRLTQPQWNLLFPRTGRLLYLFCLSQFLYVMVCRRTRRLLCPNFPPTWALLLTLPEHLSSPPDFSWVHVTRSSVLCVCFVDHCLSFFFWPLCCLFFFDIQILITQIRAKKSPCNFEESPYVATHIFSPLVIYEKCWYRVH